MTPRPIGESDLHAYVDGRLDPARQAEVLRFLDANPEEAARLADWAEGAALLREAYAAIGRTPVPARLEVRRLAAEQASRRWARSRVAIAASVALLLGGAGGWFARGSDQLTGVAAIAREAVVAHQVFAGDAGLQRTAWTAPRPSGQMAAPDLSAAGFTLRQRQVVATDEGAGSIFLYQDAAGTWLSVFVRPMQLAGMTAPMEPVPQASGWAWAKDGLGVSLIASAPLPALHGIADEVRRQVRA